GIASLFDAQVDHPVVAEDGDADGPPADGYLAAALALGVDVEEAVVFDDDPAGVAAGRAGHFAYIVGVDRIGRADQLRHRGALIGFCGFLVLPEVHGEPELVYAMRERFAGRGYATEMARAAIAEARGRGALSEIVASVDAINADSVSVLKKLGFQHVDTRPG